ncbi:hypothetical protein BDY17DRAFT_296158 [Neohortaea acidophila]|uniref:Myb-like domain-containing protein n=1 Tax=Neohortaea acidophila TaxID=245834 RepID=A0A6A6PWZ7_9PEZI|nr:uncharacterized protein BDY17DRAFT_296158 [Neohortaea acidophila]KAF2484698.1 hypothetical protein BDY17DRAFT_296158 [Neohortaea acidophila]
MPTLVSSAVGNQKVAAPKGGARRRQPPPPSPTPAKAATPASTTTDSAAVAPPSPPPTQNATVPISASPSYTEPPVVAVEEAQPVRGASVVEVETTSATTQDTSAPTIVQRGRRATSPRKRRNDEVSTEEQAQPAKRAKKASTRSNAIAQAALEGREEPAASATTTREQEQDITPPATATTAAPAQQGARKKKPAPKKPSRRKALASAAEAEPEDADADAQTDDAQTTTQRAAPKKRGRRSKKAQAAAAQAAAETADGENGDAQAGDEEADEESDPELHEIDPNTLTMWELSGDKKHGKSSERERKMAEIDWVEVARKRRDAGERAAANPQIPSAVDVVETTEGPGGTSIPRDPAPAALTPGGANVSGVQFRLVNGQIVEDETSLTIDRQARAEAEAQTDTQPIEEENDLTARVNRTTFLNDRRRDAADRVPQWKRKSDAWDDEETERFYEALRMFGTDFFIISKMFAPKTRRHIKLKFSREERLDPARINAALLGKHTKRMDLEHYARESGTDMSEFTVYTGVKQAEEVIRESMAGKEEEMLEAIREEERLEGERKREMDLKEKSRRKGQQVAKGKGGVGGEGKKRGRKKAADGEATLGGGGPHEEVG